ncbi:MAG: hypothetical protein V5A20_02245 [Salinibacter sp.]|jgi:hypothetical protein|uniref:hypothetical protein n=1 Tax=Salinibacter sp. TaxID=2065818 RepID=UPI002FC3CF0B
MNTIGSSAAGRAAYTQGVNPSQESSGAASSPEKSASSPEKSSETQQATGPSEAQDASDDTLTTQEREAISENFPEDPELSMRLYGRGRGAQTVNPNAVGGNLDVTG